jgi:chlorinating enzyme
MPKTLTPEEAGKYNEDGFHFPVRVMSEDEARTYRAKLEAFEADQGGYLTGRKRQKLYLVLTWMNDLVRHPRILDAVEDILGPDILCWQAGFFIKEPHSKGFVSWHQDSTYWGLSKPDVTTAWLALSPATLESGAMQVAAGTHSGDQLAHEDTFDPNNLLTRGQKLSTDFDRSRQIDMVLQPGEMSLHHVRLAHASQPNVTDDRRIGLAIRYVAPHVRQITGVPDSAMLVRGEDRHHNFEDPDAVALHDRVTSAREGFIYKDTDKGAHRDGGGIAGD